MAIVCHDLKLLFIMVPGTGCSVVGKVLTEQFGGKYLPENDIIKGGRIVHQRKHNSLSQILQDGLIDKDLLRDYTIAATVRNPYDHFVTYYQRIIGDWHEYSLGVQKRMADRRRASLSEHEYNALKEAIERARVRAKRRRRLLRVTGFDMWLMWTVLHSIAHAGKSHKQTTGNALRNILFPMLDGVDVVLRSERLEEGLNTLLRKLGSDTKVDLPRLNTTPGKKPYTAYYSGLAVYVVEKLFRRQLDEFGYAFGEVPKGDPLVWLTDKNVQERALPRRLEVSA